MRTSHYQERSPPFGENLSFGLPCVAGVATERERLQFLMIRDLANRPADRRVRSAYGACPAAANWPPAQPCRMIRTPATVLRSRRLRYAKPVVPPRTARPRPRYNG